MSLSRVREDVPCETCGELTVDTLRRSALHGFTTGRCRTCGTAFVLERPNAADTAATYAKADRQSRYEGRARPAPRSHDEVLDRLSSLLPDAPVVFDVGAGAGEFLRAARARGLRVSGNEISPSALDYAQRLSGIALSPEPLDKQPPESVDAVTMWCVLAHVTDPGAFLTAACSILRPGGVLFLRTPRWCVIDTIGVGLARVSRERVPQVADRRLNKRHMHLYTRDGLARVLVSSGFEPERIESVCHFGMSAASYLETMNVSRAPARAVNAIDRVIDKGWFVRNSLFAYARKPSR